MFPWAAVSSASLARLKFSLSVYMFFLTALFASAFCFWAAALAALVRLLFIAPFFSFLICTLLIVSAEIHSLFWHFCFPRISLHGVSMFIFSSQRRPCRGSYLLLIVSRNVSVTSLSFRKSTLYFVLVLLFISLFFSFSFILASNRWWSESVSAPLCTLTSCIDLRNFCPIHIWLIWFSVLWSGDILPPIIKLLNAQRSANISPFSFIVQSDFTGNGC